MSELISYILRLLASDYCVKEFLYVNKELHNIARSSLYKILPIDKLVGSDDPVLLKQYYNGNHPRGYWGVNIDVLPKLNKSLPFLLSTTVCWVEYGELYITNKPSMVKTQLSFPDIRRRVIKRVAETRNIDSLTKLLVCYFTSEISSCDEVLDLPLDMLDQALKCRDLLIIKSYKLIPRSYAQFQVLNQNNYNFARVDGILTEVAKYNDKKLTQALINWRSKDGRSCTY